MAIPLLALTMLLAMASTASAAEITDLNTYETTNQESSTSISF